ncbi:MAG: hypothetical protein WC284_00690 [Candidimonas sp.]|jgi:CDP-diglyceride synthetase
MADPSRIFHGIPAWDWLLFAYLLYRGLLAIKGGAAGLGKLALIPLVFTVWVWMPLWLDGKAGILTAAIWAVAAGTWLALGLRIAGRTEIMVDREKHTLTLPGSPLILILVLMTFVSQYWIDFAQTRAAADRHGIDNVYILADAAVSGAVAGVLAGRFLGHWRRYRHDDADPPD